MIVGKFNQKLMEYSDDFLIKAYEEIKILHETGTFQPNSEHFKELARLRMDLYSTSYDVSATCTEILEEICRRWYMEETVNKSRTLNEKESCDSNINEIDMLKEKNQKEIINYLDNSYSGAKMMGDNETMLRIARALAAFKAEPYDDEVFQEKFIEKYILDDFSERNR